MSEEKLYAVKNDEGKYWDTGMPPCWSDKTGSVFKRIDLALRLAKKYGGNIVTFIEEPEKVVLSKKQAKIVDDAHVHVLPACYISEQPDDEELLMKAYVNGYTVVKKKKYNVKVPHTGAGWWYAKPDPDINHGKGCAQPAFTGINNPQVRLTDAEIIKYGLQDCEKMEVKD